MAKIADRVYDLVKDTVESKGVKLWDVVFVKEGASKYLRIIIDKPEGITIDDCTEVSHAVDPVIDEADPIDESYYLEVCSAGLERELVREQHFTAFIGNDVKLKLYKAFEGAKEVSGKLVSFDGGNITLDISGRSVLFEKGDVAKTTLIDFEN